jgi:hypothetical protein
LQADWPLQAFTPSHLTLASAAVAVEIAAVLKSSAAADAIAAPAALVDRIMKNAPVQSRDAGCTGVTAGRSTVTRSIYRTGAAADLLPQGLT